MKIKIPKKSQAAISYVFFGSAVFSTYVLDELENAGMPPSLIVTTPDKPSGRGLALTPTEVKVWGQSRNIPVLDPAKLDADFIQTLREKTQSQNGAKNIPCFVVAAYGKIIPQALLDIPPKGTLNVHPSLLPQYRGASPLQSAMVNDTKKTGVTIMRIDALMDHGPIVAQKEITIDEWPTYEVFEENMAREGGRLLAETLPGWLASIVAEKEQDHAAATFTKKISKEDGLIDVDVRALTTSDPKLAIPSATQYDIFRKIQAYHHWPTVYFFIKKNAGEDEKKSGGQKIRVKITKASWNNDKLIIEKVIPEGKKETDFSSFIKSFI